MNVTVPAVWVNVGTAPNEPPLYMKLPDVNTKLVVGFSVPLVKSKVRPLTTKDVHIQVSAKVGVPANNVIVPVDLPLHVIVPEPTKFTLMLLVVFIEADNIILDTFTVVAGHEPLLSDAA